jgi:hypothetical protein
MAHFHVYSQTVADGTATSVVRPSDWNSGHLNSITISGNTSNFSTVSGTNIVYQGGNNVTISAATAANAATLVFSAANQTVQTQSNVQGISAGTQVGNTGNIAFNNGNGITFGMSNSSVITASHNGVTTARASNDGIGLNTAQTNVTWTVNSSGLSLNAAGYAGTGTTFAGTNVSASATFNSNGLNLALSAPSPVGGVVNFSAGTTSNNLANVVFANSNLLSFGLNGSTITGSVPATSSLVGVNLTITSAGSTISISAPVINKYEPVPLGNNTSYSSYGQNTLYFQGISPVENVSMSALDMYVSMSSASSSISHSVGQTMSYGIYSRGTGASTSRYDIMQSSSFVMQASFSSNLSGGMTLGNAATSFTSSSAGTVFASVLSGQKIVSLPFGTSLSAGGNYLLCWAVSTTSTGGTGALRASYLVQTNNANGSWGIVANSSIIIANQSIIMNPNVLAVYSATSSSWPASIGNSQFSINSNIKAYLFLEA